MGRKFCGAMLLLVIGVGLLGADELRGRIDRIDAKKGMLVIKADGTLKEMKLNVSRDTKILDAQGKEISDGLKARGFEEGAEVIVTYEKAGKKLAVKEIRQASR